MEQPSASLIERARRGDREAMAAIIRDATPGIFRFVRNMVRSEEEAADIVQETFLRMMRNLERYDATWPFYTWLYRIARNLCIDRGRHHSRWRTWFRPSDAEEEADPMDELPSTGESALDGLLAKETQEAIDRALQKLKPGYREVLLLFHFEHLSYQEIAAVLKMPIGTVMNRIFRARQQLKEELDGFLAAT